MNIEKIIRNKKSNLVVSLDVDNTQRCREIIDKIADYICGIKLHSEIIEDFDDNFADYLIEKKNNHNFFIIEDRKFADIGSICQKQLAQINKKNWADICTAHTIMGKSTIDGLANINVLLIAQASSHKNLIDEKYVENTIKIANECDNVIGFICQEFLHSNFLHFSPGVNIMNSIDNLGQKYNTPEKIIGEKKSDIIIVGRGIIEAENIEEITKKYRDEGFKYSRFN